MASDHNLQRALVNDRAIFIRIASPEPIHDRVDRRWTGATNFAPQ